MKWPHTCRPPIPAENRDPAMPNHAYVSRLSGNTVFRDCRETLEGVQ